MLLIDLMLLIDNYKFILLLLMNDGISIIVSQFLPCFHGFSFGPVGCHPDSDNSLDNHNPSEKWKRCSLQSIV